MKLLYHERREMTTIFIDYGLKEDCINQDAYELCHQCNACGRFSKETQKEDAIKMFKSLLEEQRNFDGCNKQHRERQEKNIAANIIFFEEKIKELENT